MKPDFPVVGHIHSFGVPTIYKVSFPYSSLQSPVSSIAYFLICLFPVEAAGRGEIQRREAAVYVGP